MRMHDVLPRAIFAIAVIMSGVVIAIAPAAAQSAVTSEDVTQVRGQTGQYDKINATKWVRRAIDGTPHGDFVEARHDGSSVFLVTDPPGGSVELNLSGKFYREWTVQGGVGTSTINLPITSVYGISADSSAETCRQETAAGVKCTCDLGSLRPLQGAVGLAEVMDKKDTIIKRSRGGKDSDGNKRDPLRARRELAYDPIKIVRGLGGNLFVTDHHHGARAWLEVPHTKGTCTIQSVKLSTDPGQFWLDLKREDLVRLKNEKGVAYASENELPAKLMDLPDDPYRTLAWMVRRNDGFCRALMDGHTEFAEFKWADWMRDRPELPFAKVKASPRDMLPVAQQLAEGPLAEGLPGYRTKRVPRGTFPDACPDAVGEMALD